MCPLSTGWYRRVKRNFLPALSPGASCICIVWRTALSSIRPCNELAACKDLADLRTRLVGPIELYPMTNGYVRSSVDVILLRLRRKSSACWPLQSMFLRPFSGDVSPALPGGFGEDVQAQWSPIPPGVSRRCWTYRLTVLSFSTTNTVLSSFSPFRSRCSANQMLSWSTVKR